MRPTVTDWVVWSVGLSVSLSVCHSSEPCKNFWTDRDTIWVEDSGGPKEPCIRCGPDHLWEGAILNQKGQPIVKYRDTLPWAVQKQLNRLKCRLGWGLGWVQGTMLGGGGHCATWWIPLNHPYAAAMRPVVKLLWPVVIVAAHLSFIFCFCSFHAYK